MSAKSFMTKTCGDTCQSNMPRKKVKIVTVSKGLCPAFGFSLHSSKKKMIQSDCNLVPNLLKPIKNEHRSAKIKTKSRGGGGGGLTVEWNDTTRWFSPSDHFEIHGDGPESELTLKALLYVTFSCSFVTFPQGVLGQV